MKQARLCVVINSLGCGGAERVAVTLANEWSRTGHEMSLVTLTATDVGFYPSNPRIDRRGLDVMRPSISFVGGVLANLIRLRRLRHEFRAIRPDVIISFIDCTNVLALIAAAGLGIPVVISERTDPRMSPLPPVWSALRRITYRRAAALVVQTQSVTAWARRMVDPRRVVVIPNPISETCFSRALVARRRARLHRVVAIGRLAREKGFDLLIAAFARAAAGHLDWTLVIAGEGSLAGRLREQADSTTCAARIELVGLLRAPEELLSGSEIFVLSSRHEGFPNALLEAMACGCGVIATDCRSGPAEIVNGGVDGLLVPVEDVDALATSLDALMTDDAGRRRFGAAAAVSAERFRAEGIASEWIRLLGAVSDGTPFTAIAGSEVE